MTAKRKVYLGLGLVILAAAFWSTAGLFITATVRGSGISALGLAFWRVFGAFVCLAVGLAVVQPGLLRVQRRALPWLAGMGVLAVGTFQVLWILAILTNGPSVSTVIQSNAPVIVTLIAWLVWREPLTWRKWVAIGLAFLGTLLIARVHSSGNIHLTPVGVLISLGSALAYAGITLFTKKLTAQCNAWTILTYAFGFAALALLPFQFTLPLPAQVGGQALAAFVGLVLVTTIAGYMAYALALRYLQASVAAIVAMIEVPFAAFFGYVFLGERMGAGQVLGALAVVSGVALLSLRPTREEKPNADGAEAPLVVADV